MATAIAISALCGAAPTGSPRKRSEASSETWTSWPPGAARRAAAASAGVRSPGPEAGSHHSVRPDSERPSSASSRAVVARSMTSALRPATGTASTTPVILTERVVPANGTRMVSPTEAPTIPR